jgi:hypothetical protein
MDKKAYLLKLLTLLETNDPVINGLTTIIAQ